MKAYRVANSPRGSVLISEEYLARLRAAGRVRPAPPHRRGLGDYIEWEGDDGSTCYYYEDQSGYWEQSCNGEYWTGGAGGEWQGWDAWGNYYNYELPSAGTIAIGTTFAPQPADPNLPGGGGFDFWNWLSNAFSFAPSGGGGIAQRCAPGEQEVLKRDALGNRYTVCEPISPNVPGRCPQGQYYDPQAGRCLPFPPRATEAQKRQLQEQGNRALQQMAARNAAQQQQRNPNQPLNGAGLPWWVWLIIGGGAIAILK